MDSHDSHLDNFNNGCSRVQGKSSFDKYYQPSGTIGREASGNPLANDEKGSCYWTSKSELDSLWKYQDAHLAEHELGFNDGDMRNNSFYRIDCNTPHEYNARIATGHELGANENFTGRAIDVNGNAVIDSTIYNKKTSGGLNECVTDKIDLSDCSISRVRKFDNPIEREASLSKRADKIGQMEPGDKKDELTDRWNKTAYSLDSRIDGELNYLNKRIADHEKTMANNPVGSLEYNRAADNKAWCENYWKELGESRQNLQAQYANLNGGATMPTETAKQAETGPVILSDIPQLANSKQNGSKPDLKAEPHVVSNDISGVKPASRNHDQFTNNEFTQSGIKPGQQKSSEDSLLKSAISSNDDSSKSTTLKFTGATNSNGIQ